MNEQFILSLLSGLIGALIATALTISYTEWSKSKENKKNIAREKLEKVYGPLMALKKKSDEFNQNNHSLIVASNPTERELIEKIIFHYYHLVDDDLKEGIILLHPDLSRDTTVIIKKVQLKVIDKILKHYEENKKILGLR